MPWHQKKNKNKHMVKKLYQKYAERVLFFFQDKNVKTAVFVFISVFCIVCLFYNIKRPALMFISFMMINALKTNPDFKIFLAKREADKKTIAFHWKTDRDLIYIKNFNRFFLVVVFFLVGRGSFLLVNLQVDSDVKSQLECFLYFKYGFFVYMGILVIYFLAELHIILFRNMLIIQKLWWVVEGSGKFVFVGALGLLGYTDLTSRTLIIEPNALGNFYQQHLGRGYGFASVIDHQRHSILVSSNTAYDPLQFVDKKTGLIDSQRLKAFIDANKTELKTSESVVSCQVLGLSKGILF